LRRVARTDRMRRLDDADVLAIYRPFDEEGRDIHRDLP
jgi:hypothetical protein